jgi:hypothetical protein
MGVVAYSDEEWNHEATSLSLSKQIFRGLI